MLFRSRAGFDDSMEPLAHGAIGFPHLGDLRKHGAFPVNPGFCRGCRATRILNSLGIHSGPEHFVDQREDDCRCRKNTKRRESTPCGVARGVVPNGEHTQQRRTEEAYGDHREGDQTNPPWIKNSLEAQPGLQSRRARRRLPVLRRDRKSTRLNSSHIQKSRMPSSA